MALWFDGNTSACGGKKGTGMILAFKERHNLTLSKFILLTN
jgi:hypothetical protein